MDNLSQIRTAVQSDLTIDSNSPLYPPATIDLAINRAYRKVGGLFPWPSLEDAKKTSTVADQEYYDYPQTWQPDSVWKLKVDGQDYGEPLSFEDYLYEQENDNPSGLTYMWTNQWVRFFIDPAPTANGDFNIEIWGQKVVELLSDDEDTTIFSYIMPEVNEALVLEAGAILRNKGEEQNASEFLSQQAKGIVVVAWDRIKKRQAKFQKTKPFFSVPDFFGRRKTNTKIGDFD